MFSVKETQLINQFSNQTLARSGVVIQKLMVVQLVKISRLVWNPKIIVMFTKARALTLSFSVKSISVHFPDIHFNVIYHLDLGLQISTCF
jgi:hypothetical protein